MFPNKSFLFDHGALNNRPTSRAAWKKNCGIEVIAESNRKPETCSSCEEELSLTRLFFPNWCVVCGLLWQDFCVGISCLKICD